MRRPKHGHCLDGTGSIAKRLLKNLSEFGGVMSGPHRSTRHIHTDQPDIWFIRRKDSPVEAHIIIPGEGKYSITFGERVDQDVEEKIKEIFFKAVGLKPKREKKSPRSIPISLINSVRSGDQKETETLASTIETHTDEIVVTSPEHKEPTHKPKISSQLGELIETALLDIISDRNSWHSLIITRDTREPEILQITATIPNLYVSISEIISYILGKKFGFSHLKFWLRKLEKLGKVRIVKTNERVTTRKKGRPPSVYRVHIKINPRQLQIKIS